MIDVTARRQAETARERLQAATTALAGAVTVADVARVTVEQSRLALEADMAVVLSFDPERERLEMIDDHGLSPEARSRWHAVTLDQPMPATRAAARWRACSSPTSRRCWSCSRSWPGSRTRARAPTRPCRCWPTAARRASSRSASGAGSRSTPTSARC